MSFTLHQPVKIRRRDFTTWTRGWYLRPDGAYRHDVLLRNGDITVVADDNIRADDQAITLQGFLWIWRDDKGRLFTTGPTPCDDSAILDMSRARGDGALVGNVLISIIDLSRYGIEFCEGQGMHPRQSAATLIRNQRESHS